MDKIERLVALGLSTDEATLLTLPITELDIEQLKVAVSILVKKHGLVRETNKTFVPTEYKGPHQLIQTGFDAFQSPVDTNVIITSERQRQDEMKKHGCFDAREAIPHGKTSLLDGQL